MTPTSFLTGTSGRAVLMLARVVFWAAAAAVLVALCQRGLTLGDEGYLLSQANDMLNGKVPYRDLDLFVTPGVWYLIEALFSFTGPSVIATRIAAAVCLLATMLTVRRIVKASGGPLWGDFGAGLIPVFAVWAWPAWSFSFYSPWATLASLVGLTCALQWMNSRRSTWLVLCGLSVGIAVAFKQNYGVFAAAGCFGAVLLDEVAVAPSLVGDWRQFARRGARSAAAIALGGALALLPLAAWLAHQGALAAAFDSLVLRPFGEFAQAHSIAFLRLENLWSRNQLWSTAGLIYAAVPVSVTGLRFNWPGPAVTLVELLHVLLYWGPVLAFVGLGAHGLQRLRQNPTWSERALLATTVFAAAFFLGVLPRADFNHLINVYPPVLAMIAAAMAVHFGEGRWNTTPLRRACAGSAAVAFFSFSLIAVVWMNDLRKRYWIPIDAPRAGVLLEPMAAELFNYEVRLLQEMTDKDEPVFALPGLSMIPFLAERPMPTRYYNYYAVHIGRDHGREAAQEIERSGANVVLADYKNFFSDPVGMTTYAPELANYLKRNFRPEIAVSVQHHMVLKKRATPLEYGPSRGLWMSCEVRPGAMPGRIVREHLLYHSLYHAFRGAWGTRNERLTVCQIQVPMDARLHLALELRQPGLAEEPATATAQMWLLPNHGRAHRLLEHALPLASESGGSHPTWDEFEIDLSRWEGEVVTLLLRTLVEGPVPPFSQDFDGLSVMWNDARIESPEYAAPSSSEP